MHRATAIGSCGGCFMFLLNKFIINCELDWFLIFFTILTHYFYSISDNKKQTTLFKIDSLFCIYAIQLLLQKFLINVLFIL